jgi:hypothetical protein
MNPYKGDNGALFRFGHGPGSAAAASTAAFESSAVILPGGALAVHAAGITVVVASNFSVPGKGLGTPAHSFSHNTTANTQSDWHIVVEPYGGGGAAGSAGSSLS